MENNKGLIDKIKGLMTQYGFIEEKPEIEYKSFKVGEKEELFQAEVLEVGKELFVINEESGERELVADGTYQIEDFNVEVKEGKIEKVESKFAEVKLVDGSVLMVSGEVAVGAEVMVITDEGNVPAPDGSYELEDGMIIVIADGVITEIQEPNAEPAPEDTPAPEVEMEDETKNQFQELLAMFIELAQELSTKLDSVEMNVNTLSEEFNSLKEDYQTFKKEPAAEPIKDRKVDEKPESPADRVSRIRSMVNKK